MSLNNLKNKSLLIEFEAYLSTIGKFEKEVVFSHVMDTKRRYRADYMLPDKKVIIEINGGQWNRGRHNRGGKGYENDLNKLNTAQMNGYKVFQFTYEMLERLEYKEILKDL